MVYTRYVDSREEQYRRNVRLATILALTITIVAFLWLRQPEPKHYGPRTGIRATLILPDNVVLTELPESPKVVRPRLPVADPGGEASDPSVGQHEWVDTVRHVSVPVLEAVPFWRVEVKPQALHLETPVYPEICRLTGIEGQVVVRALVDSTGSVSDVQLAASSGSSVLDTAAIAAARKSRFSPGRQRDRAVAVWVSIPFRFRLQ